jgi:hypothetical protein
MNPFTHGLLAWIVSVPFLKNINDRRLVIVTGVISDIDGFFILFDNDLFLSYHHTFAHSLIFGSIFCTVIGLFAKEKRKVVLVGFGIFLLHLMSDIIGSNWPVYFLYPVSEYGLTGSIWLSNWLIYQVVNPIVSIMAIAITIVIMFVCNQSPFEFVSEKLDNIFVGFFVFPFRYRCEICNRRAFFKCTNCGMFVCQKHSGNGINIICSNC